MLGTRWRCHRSDACVLGRETRHQTRARAQGDGVGDKFRMCAADRAFRSEPRFHNNRGLPHRDRQVVHACLLHTSETWSWTKDLVRRAAWLGEQVRGDDWDETMAWAVVGSHSRFIVRIRFGWPANALGKAVNWTAS